MARNSAKRLFNPQMIDRLRAEKGRRIELMDSNCPGLVLRVTDRGAKSFSAIFRVANAGEPGPGGVRRAGSQKRITLGIWPQLGLREARERARHIVGEASEGRDPTVAREAEKEAVDTTRLDRVVDQFVDRYCRQNVTSWQNVERVLRLHVLPRWGAWPMAEIRRSHIHSLMDDLIDDGRRGTAREVRKHLSKLFNWAIDREIVAASPMHGLKREELAPREDVGRSLKDDELKAIWQGAQELGYPFGPYYQLLILTGQRRAEWAEAQRSEIDTANRLLEVPRARYKGRRDHVVPLSDAAWAIFEALPAWVGNDYYLFSSQGGRTPIAGFTQGKRRLDESAREALRKIKHDPRLTLQSYRVHDFRVTCETRLALLGFGQDIRDAVLGHAKPGLQRTYNKHDYLTEKRKALAAYAEHIASLVS